MDINVPPTLENVPLRLLQLKKTSIAIFWGNWRAGKKLVPCAQKLAERGDKATPTHANSVVSLMSPNAG